MSTETYSPPAGGIDGEALSAAGLRLAVVVSRFNHFVTYKLRDGAIEAIQKAGGLLEPNDVIEIPGAWEFPVIVRALTHRGYDAIVCVGAVIRGDTPHFDYVAGEAARGIADASAETGVPIAFGILTTNTVEQATDRAGGKLGNKGAEAAMTAIEMALTLRKIRAAAETAPPAVAKLMARHKSREQTLQMLFEWDLRRRPVEEIARDFYGSLLVSEDSPAKPRPDQFAQNLLVGVTQELAAIDELISKHAANWRIERMPAVDRNVLRVAVYEMLRTETPPPIVIDEALELARRFAGEESVQFVNGVLDAVRRELPPKQG